MTSSERQGRSGAARRRLARVPPRRGETPHAYEGPAVTAFSPERAPRRGGEGAASRAGATVGVEATVGVDASREGAGAPPASTRPGSGPPSSASPLGATAASGATGRRAPAPASASPGQGIAGRVRASGEAPSGARAGVSGSVAACATGSGAARCGGAPAPCLGPAGGQRRQVDAPRVRAPVSPTRPRRPRAVSGSGWEGVGGVWVRGGE